MKNGLHGQRGHDNINTPPPLPNNRFYDYTRPVAGGSALSTYETECAILRASEGALKQFDDATQVPTCPGWREELPVVEGVAPVDPLFQLVLCLRAKFARGPKPLLPHK